MLKKNFKPSVNNVLAVVITFNPDNNLINRLKKIKPQVKDLLIIDNKSDNECVKMIQKISKELKIPLIENHINLGVAEALNQGFEYAKTFDEKYSWVLSLDQDTFCFSELIDQLTLAYENCPFKNEIGILGSNYEEMTTGKILHKSRNNHKSWDEVKNLPTSGSLTSLEAFSNVGNFRTDFFIDYVDTEYCIRLRRKGYRILICPKVCMIHPLGYYRESFLHNILFKNKSVTNYPPFRHYYWTRNGLRLILENLSNNFIWSLKEFNYLFFKRTLTVLIFEDKKIIKLGNIFLGIWHVIRHKHGKKE